MRIERRASFGVVFALAVATLLACGGGSGDTKDDNNFRPDVIQCEDALDRLERCCPGFDARPVLCNFYYDQQTGCGTTSTQSVKPALSSDESACIRDTSCDDLQSRGVCARAQAARAYTYSSTDDNLFATDASTTSSSHLPVCP